MILVTRSTGRDAEAKRHFRRDRSLFFAKGNPPAGPVFVASDNRSVR
jgi:hypothetical protein